jgi:hypothetical protein
MYPSLNKSVSIICTWLEQTPVSHAIQVTSWVVPAVQTVHILAIAAVASSALMIDLRLLGLVAADQPLKDVSSLLDWPTEHLPSVIFSRHLSSQDRTRAPRSAYGPLWSPSTPILTAFSPARA